MDMGDTGTVVVMENDPRFEPFNSITDDAGQVLPDFAPIPAGTLIGTEGVFKTCDEPDDPVTGPCFSARVVEGLFIADLGGTGFVSIQRAQCKTGKRESRVRGSAAPSAAIVSIAELDADC